MAVNLSEGQKDALYTVAQQAMIRLVHHQPDTEEDAWGIASKNIGHASTIKSLEKKGLLANGSLTEAGIAEAKKVYGNTTHRGTVQREDFDARVVKGREEVEEIREETHRREEEWNAYLASLPELAGYQPAQGHPFTVRWRSVEFARVPEIAIKDKRAPHGSEDRYHEAEWVFSGGAVSYMDPEALEDYRNALKVAQEVMESLIEKYKDAPVKSYV